MSTAAQKLGMKPGDRIAVQGMKPSEVAALVGELPDGVAFDSRGASQVAQLILVAASLADLARMLPGAFDDIAPNGRLWVWYRKGASRAKVEAYERPLHRDTLQALLADHGLDGVTLLSIDAVWSSMRVKAV